MSPTNCLCMISIRLLFFNLPICIIRFRPKRVVEEMCKGTVVEKLVVAVIHMCKLFELVVVGIVMVEAVMVVVAMVAVGMVGVGMVAVAVVMEAVVMEVVVVSLCEL